MNVEKRILIQASIILEHTISELKEGTIEEFRLSLDIQSIACWLNVWKDSFITKRNAIDLINDCYNINHPDVKLVQELVEAVLDLHYSREPQGRNNWRLTAV